jgi:hypothetical protein
VAGSCLAARSRGGDGAVEYEQLDFTDFRGEVVRNFGAVGDIEVSAQDGLGAIAVRSNSTARGRARATRSTV